MFDKGSGPAISGILEHCVLAFEQPERFHLFRSADEALAEQKAFQSLVRTKTRVHQKEQKRTALHSALLIKLAKQSLSSRPNRRKLRLIFLRQEAGPCGIRQGLR